MRANLKRHNWSNRTSKAIGSARQWSCDASINLYRTATVGILAKAIRKYIQVVYEYKRVTYECIRVTYEYKRVTYAYKYIRVT